MPDTKIKGLGITTTGQFASAVEVNQKMGLIEKAINDSLSTSNFADGANSKEGVIYRNPNIQDGVGSHWSHPFMCMGS
jgi:hypothetical protein